VNRCVAAAESCYLNDEIVDAVEFYAKAKLGYDAQLEPDNEKSLGTERDFIVVNPKASKANKIRQLRNFANITEKVLGFENATTLKTWNGLGMILKTEGVGTSNLQML